MCGTLEDLMILVGSVLWNASVTLIKNKDVYDDSQLSAGASGGNENNVCRRRSENVYVNVPGGAKFYISLSPLLTPVRKC